MNTCEITEIYRDTGSNKLFTGCRLSEKGFHLTKAIKRNEVSGNRTITNAVMDSKVEEKITAIFRRPGANARTERLPASIVLGFLPLYSSSVVFPPACAISFYKKHL